MQTALFSFRSHFPLLAHILHYQRFWGQRMNKEQDILRHLQENKSALLALMQSADGQQLIRLLNQAQGSGALKQAAGAAARGNTAELSNMISELMARPEGAELIRRISEKAKQ